MYEKAAKGWLKHFDFVVLDLLCLQIAFVLACITRYGLSNPYSGEQFLSEAVVMALIQVSVAFFYEPYKNILKRGYYQEFVNMIKCSFVIILLTAFYLFVIQEGRAYSRKTLLYMSAYYLVIGYVARLFWKECIKAKKDAGGRRSLIVVSTSSMADQAVHNIQENNYDGYIVTGVVLLDKDLTGQKIAGIPVVASRDTVADYVCREWVDEIFLDIPEEEPVPQKVMRDLAEMGVTIHQKIALAVSTKGRVQRVERLGKYTVLTTSMNMASHKQLAFKRLLDITGGIVGCLMTLVFMIVVGPAIYIQSPGPIFFSQVRIGKNGKKFRMYKFRSMYMDAEKRKKELMEQNRVADGLMFKMDDDPRIIGGKKGVGGIIRKFSIDEFPQFFNVLKGDMSLVGTRPPTVDEWEKYDLHHRSRLAIKPGITGMWQVSGRSDITDFEEVVRLDQEYIENWNIGLDIKILLKTVKAVFAKDGAM